MCYLSRIIGWYYCSSCPDPSGTVPHFHYCCHFHFYFPASSYGLSSLHLQRSMQSRYRWNYPCLRNKDMYLYMYRKKLAQSEGESIKKKYKPHFSVCFHILFQFGKKTKTERLYNRIQLYINLSYIIDFVTRY